MILYFSATGNSKYVALRIAEATDDEAVSIEEFRAEKHPVITVPAGERLGFVCPTYAWGLPSLVRDFFDAMTIEAEADTYVFYVGTYGTMVGQPARMANKCAGFAKHPITAMFDVKMPDTWTPLFDLSDERKVAARNGAAETLIDEAVAHIIACDTGDFMRDKAIPAAATVYHKLGYPGMRKTKHFDVEDTCIGCGLCAGTCPTGAIEMKDKRPVWVQAQCSACLRCLHRCPTFSIQRGRKTKAHGQYVNPHVVKGSKNARFDDAIG